MPRSRWLNTNFLPVAGLIALTVIHIAWRAAPSPRKALALSGFKIGAVVPRYSAEQLGAGPGSAPAIPTKGCRVVVAFSSTCPHCHAAFSRARDKSRENRPPVIWMADGRDKGAPKLLSELGAGDYLARSADAWQALKVSAVPAAFLIGDDERVKQVWVYQGDEAPDSLRALCTGA